jgi:hypothetical protein
MNDKFRKFGTVPKGGILIDPNRPEAIYSKEQIENCLVMGCTKEGKGFIGLEDEETKAIYDVLSIYEMPTPEGWTVILKSWVPVILSFSRTGERRQFGLTAEDVMDRELVSSFPNKQMMEYFRSAYSNITAVVKDKIISEEVSKNFN